MIFPVIDPPRMKNSDKKGNSQPQIPMSLDQFGLGIQVFKIESSKLTQQEDRHKPRKVIKNIENPAFLKSTAPIPKKQHVLPSLSVERKMAITSQNDITKERRSTIEKKKKPPVPATAKDLEEKKVLLDKKPVPAQQASKNQLPEAIVPATREKQIVYQHFKGPLNEVLNFQLRLEEEENGNLREIRRLRKEKEGEAELEWRTRCKGQRGLLVQTIVNEERPFFWSEDDEGGESSVEEYMRGGCQFKYYDKVEVEGDM